MLSKTLLAALCFASICVSAQYKNDNVKFKTVDPTDLCSFLQANPGYLILDVRSKGECDDSSSGGLNIGRIKGATNIDVGELGSRLNEIANYRELPVFVYCSHSQRSRRASAMLADSGFTNVFNINGGMTAVYYTNAYEEGCLKSMVETKNTYSTISAGDACDRISRKKDDVYLLDVRTDSAFRHITSDPRTNAMGTLRGSINIPFADLESKLGSVPKDKNIILIDINNVDAARAAGILRKNGYSRVDVMIEGIGRMLSTSTAELPCKEKLYISPVEFSVVSAIDFGQMMKNKKEYVFLDVRTVDEFTNKHKDYWRNIGHLENAINIPVADIDKRGGELDNNKEIIVYSFGGGTEAYAAGESLSKLGFKKVTVLSGGIFNLRWTAANRKGQQDLKKYVVDVPEVNW